MPQFIVTTLGCKVNQYESAAMAETLRQAGWSEFAGAGHVELCVVHTCCITGRAAGKSRQLIRRLASAHPEAHVVATGCYATWRPAEVRRVSGVTTIAGHRDDIAAHLARVANESQRSQATVAAPPKPQVGAGRDDSTKHYDAGQPPNEATDSSLFIKPNSPGRVKDFHTGASNLASLRKFSGRHRAMVKVQDGCDCFCSYCIVPHLRGRPRSRDAGEILAETRRLVDADHKEIVLCGVCLGAYGRDRTRAAPGDDVNALADLIERVITEASPPRLRLSSLAPADVTDRVLTVMAAHDNICPHLHLPLQSGSGDILARMNRPYTADEYAEMIDRVRDRLDRPAITTDVIVGFPGEGDGQFAETLEMVRRAGFSKVHVFPYSARADTAAAKWTDESPPAGVVKLRCKQLAELAAKTAGEFHDGFVNEQTEVLIEQASSGSPDDMVGFTSRYVRVEAACPAELIGQIVPVRITSRAAAGLMGELVGTQ